MNTWESVYNEKCNYAINQFVNLAIVVCYTFLLVYSWVWLGFTYRIKVPYTKTFYTITIQFSSLYWVSYAYMAVGSFSFIVWIIGASFLNLGAFCADTAPRLYAFATFLNVVYWLGFAVVCAIVINKVFGDVIKTYIADQLDEPGNVYILLYLDLNYPSFV